MAYYTELICIQDTDEKSYSQQKLTHPIPRPKRRRQNAARERKLIHLPSMQLREAFSYSFPSLESDAGGRAVPKRVEKGPVLNNELFIAFSSISAKPVGVGAASQPWILAGERSGLLRRLAMTVNASLCRRMKS